jgi:hypothetical protein
MGRYERPQFRDVGSVHELTLQQYNKVGRTEDAYTLISNGVIIGSLVPAPD